MAGCLLRLPDRRPRRGRHAVRSRQRALPAQERGGGRDVRLGRRPAPAHPLVAHRHLRGPRQGLHQAPSRSAARAARHLRGPRLRRGGAAPHRAGRHRGRAAAHPPLGHREVPGRSRVHELLGLQLDRLLLPGLALLLLGTAGPAGGRVQDHGEAAAPGRHRGHPRRGVQPHRGGQPPGPDALLPRHRQRGLLPPVPRGSPLLRGLHRHAATRSTCGTRARSSS